MLIKLYEENTNQKEIDKIVAALRDGAVIIYPTDTVYAMGCDAMNTKAVERVCKFKGINPDKSTLSIICSDLSEVSEFTKVDNKMFKIIRRNLPGAFTFILETTSSLPKIYKNRKTVGVRVPDNKIILQIQSALGNPIMTTSIKNDKPDETEYITDPELIYEKYGEIVDIVIDGGYGGVEGSTVVDCTGNEYEIIRQGKGELIL